MSKYLIVVPRWSGTPKNDWYPWLSDLLADQNIFTSVQIADMPNPSEPTIATWTSALLNILAEHKQHLNDVVLVGHSVGFQAVLHSLQHLDEGQQLGAVIGIAAWWDVDNPWESIRPWIAQNHDYSQIKLAAKTITILLSDNDPFTSDFKTNATLWEERLNATVNIVAGAKHFNAAEQLSVYELLCKVATI